MLQIPLNCPHCRKQDVAFTLRSSVLTKKTDSYAQVTSMATCNHCGRGVVGHSQLPEYLPHSFKGIESTDISDLGWNLRWLPEPSKPDIPEHTPPQVLSSLLEAEKLYLLGDDFVRSAGNAYRSAIEAALSLKDSEGGDKNLNWRINRLVAEGVLTREMGNFAHHIRQLGNEASHALLDFDAESLQQMRLFAKLLIMYLFTLPGMIPSEVGK